MVTFSVKLPLSLIDTIIKKLVNFGMRSLVVSRIEYFHWNGDVCMSGRKVCPFFGLGNCATEECGIWSEENNACSIRVIAEKKPLTFAFCPGCSCDLPDCHDKGDDGR